MFLIEKTKLEIALAILVVNCFAKNLSFSLKQLK